MQWFQYLSLACLCIMLIAFLWHFLRLIRLGTPKDLSKKTGDIPKAEAYSFTSAMLPNHKESAYLHIPSFTSGVIFHLGTFLSILLFIIFFFISPEQFPMWLRYAIEIALIASAGCGFGLFIKRFAVHKMRSLSHPDDYLSNLMTTLFQVMTGLFVFQGLTFSVWYYVMVSILLIYMPVGKLRHLVYFFAARYHLGYFYGWRNTWPPKND